MQTFIFRVGTFMLINFGGLYLGAQLQGEGPSSQWYQDLNIAPWTPPGWVFGAAWTTIMICFSFCLAMLLDKMERKSLVPVFLLQFILNVG